MKTITRQSFLEFVAFILLSLGIVIIAQAQDTTVLNNKSSVQIEVEIQENGRSTKTNKYFEINSEAFSEEVEEMVSEIEEVLKHALSDLEHTEIEVNIHKHFNDIEFPDFKSVTSAIPKFEWQNHKVETTAFLGIQGKDIAESESIKGITVTNIIPGSAAEKSGLKKGDIITTIDDLEITSFQECTSYIKTKRPGDQINIVVYRNDVEMMYSVTLEQMEIERNVLIMRVENEDGIKEISFPDYLTQGCYPKDKNTPKLGIEVAQNSSGIQVMKVLPNSLAADLGIEVGDIITAVDDSIINDLASLTSSVSSKNEGEIITITLNRNGYKKTVTSIISNPKIRSKTIYKAHIQHVNDEEIKMIQNISGQNLDSKNSLPIQSIKVSPNPSNGVFEIEINLIEKGTLEAIVFNAYGAEIYTESIKADQPGLKHFTVNITDAPVGMYYLSLLQNGKGLTQRLIKE